jgi:hypothetical protein
MFIKTLTVTVTIHIFWLTIVNMFMQALTTYIAFDQVLLNMLSL